MFNEYKLLNSMDLVQKNVWLRLTPYLVLLVLEMFIDVSECATQSEIDKHLELGKEYLARGQLGDALSQYHSAVEGDPNNYLTYFKRGTVYLALGKAKNALSDLDRVLEIKPDFTAARISRGNIHLKQANYDLAQLDFYNVLKVDPKRKKRSAEYYYGHSDYPTAIHYISETIEVSPWSPDLYEFRAELHMLNGDEISAITDIKSTTKLQSDNTDGYFKLAQLLYKIGHATEALKSIRECLKLDPEHKDCFPFYKKIKKIEKFIAEAETALENKKFCRMSKRILCACYSNDEQSSEAISACTEALALNDDPSIYCDRAEAYLQSEMYDDAIKDYKSALEIDSHFERAKEGLTKAENRQKQAERRDYYKILGVLTDEEKRRQFDNGEDPLDPESGKGGPPNFHHFHTFHGSPFQFKFHFN
ncbi:hypothetical protein NQ317_004126 [Molorchus minor]|uniref:Uncharacterized protein n=1 Tax=Molorchus minor TaxID=1323400 RepID=A0ABQ9JQ64_9CUCU|nr:hypothetical protein NQ317_004126 [Molorchus minor]